MRDDIDRSEGNKRYEIGRNEESFVGWILNTSIKNDIVGSYRSVVAIIIDLRASFRIEFERFTTGENNDNEVLCSLYRFSC